MEDAPMEPAVQRESFPMTTLPDSPPSLDVLSRAIPQRTRRIPECSVFCETLLSLLNNVHDAVRIHDNQSKTTFCNLVKSFIKFLRPKPLLARLAGGESMASTLHDLCSKADSLFIVVGLPTQQWGGDWERGKDVQAQTLQRLVGASAPRMLIGEMRSERKLTQAMLDIYLWLQGDDEGALRGLKRETCDRLRVHLGIETRVITSELMTALDLEQRSILPIFNWFIAERDVEYIGEPIGSGSCGVVSRAKWRRRDGTVQDVIVKTMFYDGAGSEIPFLKKLQFWHELPRHPNIIQLYGGCHLAARPFFVCEDAHNGDIVSFLAETENRGMFWSLSLQAAQGLQELHEHHIVHDGLKGSNILVGENNTPKISDFACSTIRSLSATFSQQAKDAEESAVRWRPREKLIEVENALPHYRSDVYSLGMCILEAMTQDIPFGIETLDTEVLDNVMEGVPYERPSQASDEEWNVLRRFIAFDINDLPDIPEVIELIRTLIPATE